MDTKKYALALDIGGTFIKSGLIQASGEAVEIPPVAVDSDAEAGKIIQSFSDAIEAGLHKADELTGRCEVGGIGLAIPDPFDYYKGVSLMKHKFASLYGMELSAEIHKRLPKIKDVPIRFCHDANAFIIGETWRGAGAGFSRVIGVTLGTGIGVAASVDGNVLVSELGSPADEVSLWNKPYKDGTVEDAVSSRRIISQYKKSHPTYDIAQGVKPIAEAAIRGETDAKAIFDQLGEDLGNALTPLTKSLKAQMIIFGGQIAKSFSLIEPSLKATLKKMDTPPAVCVGKLGGLAQLYGAVSWWKA
jgi:glucokinase